MEYKDYIKYMCLYGIDYIWNNTYPDLELSIAYRLKLQKDILLYKQGIPSAKPCLRCGLAYHTFKECNAEKDINNNYIDDGKELNGCIKCGREDHYASLCFYIS